MVDKNIRPKCTKCNKPIMARMDYLSGQHSWCFRGVVWHKRGTLTDHDLGMLSKALRQPPSPGIGFIQSH